MSNFDAGVQPCDNFTDNDPLYNVHSCYCPFDGTPRCESTVAFCENCHKDHHADGYDTCACQLQTIEVAPKRAGRGK